MSSRYIPNPAMIPELMVSPELAVEMGLRGEAIASLASDLAPVDTGRLAASLASQVGPGEVTVYSDVEYAAYVEFGTSDTSAQPFLRPAGDQIVG